MVSCRLVAFLVGFPQRNCEIHDNFARLPPAELSFIVFFCFCRAFFFFFFFLSPIPAADAHKVAQAYPQLASKELTFGFKVIYKDLVRTRRLLLLFRGGNFMTGCFVRQA